MLKIENLTKYYGKLKAVDNLSLEVKKGEIFGFIGPNGAGKSTTIKCIMNQINKTSGKIYIDKELVTKDNYKIKEKIGYLPSEVHLYEDYKVSDIIKYSDSFYSFNTLDKALELATYLELDLNKKIEDLSLGNLKKLGIVLALMHNPDLIILDEPTSGLDPLIQEKFYTLLKKEKEKGKTIFLSTHILSEVKKVCDSVALLKDGKILKKDKIENIIDKHSVFVTIKSNNLEEIKDKLSIKQEGNKFLYDKDINELLKIFIGNKKAYKITYIVSTTILILLTAVASILVLYIHNIAIVIILAYLWYLEVIEIRRYNRRKNIEKIIHNMEKEKILN